MASVYEFLVLSVKWQELLLTEFYFFLHSIGLTYLVLRLLVTEVLIQEKAIRL